MADADIIRCTGCRMDHRADNFELDRLGRRRKTCLSCKAKREARKHQCDHCEKTFGQKGDLNKHVRAVHEKQRDFKCEQCEKTFGQKVNLDKHVRTVHEGRRDFKCELCDAAFGQKVNLDTHVRTVHEKRRDFHCELCSKAFGEKVNLDKHVRTIHDKRRDFKCDHCDETFTAGSSLDKHVRTVHEKVRDFKCEQCEKTFGSNGDHLRHIRTVHENQRDFHCELCEKTFGQKVHLNAHSLICTGELNCSSGELACMKALDAMGMSYTRDRTHEGLTSETGKRLRFDFVLEWKTAVLVIEYDGQQHFNPVCFGGISQEDAQAAFEKQQQHDKLKDDYCASKGIPLLRIPYTKFGEIPQLITDFIVGNTDWGAEPEKQGLRPTLTDDELTSLLADFGF